MALNRPGITLIYLIRGQVVRHLPKRNLDDKPDPRDRGIRPEWALLRKRLNQPNSPGPESHSRSYLPH